MQCVSNWCDMAGAGHVWVCADDPYAYDPPSTAPTAAPDAETVVKAEGATSLVGTGTLSAAGLEFHVGTTTFPLHNMNSWTNPVGNGRPRLSGGNRYVLGLRAQNRAGAWSHNAWTGATLLPVLPWC